jgi:hypothetical protein
VATIRQQETTMRRFLALILAGTLGTFGLAACGGDDDDSGAPTTGERSDADSSDDTADDETDGTEASGGEGADELRALLEKQSKARIKVTYVTTDADGTETEMTIAQDGKGRTAIIADGSLMIAGPDGTISCDGTGSDASCTQMPDGLGELGMLGLTMFTSIGQGMLEGIDELDGVDTERDEVAGRDAICVDWDGSSLLGLLGDLGESTDDVPADGKVRVCIDEETGFLLEFSGEGDGDSFSLIATEVGEPDDSDFEPPSTPETMPDLGDFDIDELLERGAGG